MKAIGGGLLLLAGALPPSSPDLGKEQGRCRASENGSAFIIDVVGLKDRKGWLKAEIYPANEGDFLADDNVLVGAGKTFSRVEQGIPPRGPAKLCIRVPRPGTYAVVVLHDRNQNRLFNWTVDGIGFAGNPKLGFSKPKVEKAIGRVGTVPTEIQIVLNYYRGFGMEPL